MIIDDSTLEIYNTDCIDCIHYSGACLCLAFPDGIPNKIIRSVVDHRKPYPGDNGIQYEAAKY